MAALGCAGDNDFERIVTEVTKRVVGVDLNPEYVERLRARYQDRIPNLELFVGDIQAEGIIFDPVDLVFAGLLFEYVDVELVLNRVRALLIAGGILGTVVQLPHSTCAAVTPSPFSSIQTLAGFMRLVPPEQLRNLADTCGFEQVESRCMESSGGKRFQVQTFRRLPDTSGNAKV